MREKKGARTSDVGSAHDKVGSRSEKLGREGLYPKAHGVNSTRIALVSVSTLLLHLLKTHGKELT